MLARLRFLTAGESHGPALTGILEGMPAGLVLDRDALQRDMARRRTGFGRSARMQIEGDVVEITGGVRRGRTLGSPIAFVIHNRDHDRWRESMSVWPVDDDQAAKRRVTVPRPGHADLAGMQKLGTDDARDILERASARETAARTAVGALCRQLLSSCGVTVGSHVVAVGAVAAAVRSDGSVQALSARADLSAVRCVDDDAAAQMVATIEAARGVGETLGGAFEVCADGLPVGLGHFTHWDRRLTSRLAEALASIHAIREVSFGDADTIVAGGRTFHDPILPMPGGPGRASNHAGGLEGGMTNGMRLRVRARMKPLSTVGGGLPSVDVDTGQAAPGHVERSDTCAVPAASVVGEAMACIVLADALLEKFGGDSVDQLRAHMAQSAVYGPR